MKYIKSRLRKKCKHCGKFNNYQYTQAEFSKNEEIEFIMWMENQSKLLYKRFKHIDYSKLNGGKVKMFE